jgi:guanosine-3',5'-bis(diphosphate) 3'-pyrophosphohydrolase
VPPAGISVTLVAMPDRNADLGLVLKAVRFATWKHRDQKRKDAKASPYINHPVALAELLWREGRVDDAVVIASALLHDTLEDTETSPAELKGAFGAQIAAIVEEVTDVKWLDSKSRKRLQVARAGRASQRAKLVKIADKICNLRDILASPPKGWSLERKRAYFDWAKSVVDQLRGVSPRLERNFDRLYRRRP